MTLAAPAHRRWLFGPAPDLLFGCGLGYALLIGALAVAPISRSSLVAFGALATFLIGMPHYGATLLRVYERREDRRKYAFFSVYVSLAVWLFFAAGLYDLTVGSLLVTIYFTWSPWHYTGQNYGLALMFLRRRGVSVTKPAKRLIYASFILSYVLTFLTVHTAVGPADYAPDYNVGESIYAFMRLGIPASIGSVLLPVTWVAYAITLIGAASLLLRGARVRDLGPSALLVATQACWFSFPTLATHLTGKQLGSESVAFLFLWIAIGHSVQYLWITTYYAAASDQAGKHLPYLGKTLAAGALIWTLPAIVFAPDLLGRVPYNLGLFLLIAAAVNVQHFILDGAIWKLRDGRVARVLLAQPSTQGGARAAADAPRRAWRGLIWGLGALSFAISVAGFWEFEFGYRASVQRDDLVRAETAAKHLVWIGRDHPDFQVVRGNRSMKIRDFPAAQRAYERSLALHPTARAWVGIGLVHEMKNQPDLSLKAYQAALKLDPNNPQALHRTGVYWLAHDDPARALRALRRAKAQGSGNPQIQGDLAKAAQALRDRGRTP